MSELRLEPAFPRVIQRAAQVIPSRRVPKRRYIMSKFSSYKNSQKLFDSWRKYMLNEDLEVVLTNEEAGELFGEEVEDLLNKADAQDLEVQQERELTGTEEKEKERIVKGMKKSKKDFKKRYGKDAESVMYATATKQAKKNA